MTEATHVGRFTVKVRTVIPFRFPTLYYGQVWDGDTLITETQGGVNYEVEKAHALAFARDLESEQEDD